MTHMLSVIVLLAAILAIAAVQVARRLDRLHTAVMKSRHALERAMSARMNAARDFAASGGLDPASSLLLIEAADVCQAAEHNPICGDGLESLDKHHADPKGAAERVAAESALTRALRLTVDELAAVERLDPTGPPTTAAAADGTHSGTPPPVALTSEQNELFSKLQRSRLDVKLTRAFHNSHVDQVRRLRRNTLVRLFRLAGKAPVPQTVDLDDE